MTETCKYFERTEEGFPLCMCPKDKPELCLELPNCLFTKYINNLDEEVENIEKKMQEEKK